MDSLTQIVLGAAVGDLCLGRKIGNRAMLWGGIAGTIPDLDVLTSPFISPLQGLIFHRGISHSILFSVVAPFLLAWLVKRYYDSNLYSSKGIRKLASVVASIVTLTFFGGLGYIFYFLNPGLLSILTFGAGLILAIFITFNTWTKYGLINEVLDIKVSYKEWYWFFFWTIFTHPILDCFTTYGTQLFTPFNNSRISWDNISVADPFYTIPFGLLLMIASFFNRNSRKRLILTVASIVISTLYMNFTFYNKHQVNKVLENTLKDQNITYSRYMTGPTILNNFLWNATVETDTSFYTGLYSIFDKEKKFKLIEIPKNHHLLGEKKNSDYAIQKLRWFSNDYFTVIKREDGKLQFNDLRFGLLSNETLPKEKDYIFKFPLLLKSDGSYDITKESGRPDRGNEREMMEELIKRIKGI